MVLAFIFILSGVAIATLTLAKRFEMKKGSLAGKTFLLRAVSRGDERARDLYHKSLRFYTEGKHKFLFFAKKQAPLKIRIYINKALAYAKEKGENRFGNIRNSRLIRKPDGISEFFKSISEVEKGAGELHDDVYVEEEGIITSTTLVAEEVEVTVPMPEPEETIPAAAATIPEKIEKPKKPRAPRKPRVRKIKVEVAEN